jgi:hypothetical protein
MRVTPLFVLTTVIDFSVPDPVRVVPAGSSEQLAEVMTKATGNVSVVEPPPPATAGPATNAEIAVDTAMMTKRFN